MFHNALLSITDSIYSQNFLGQSLIFLAHTSESFLWSYIISMIMFSHSASYLPTENSLNIIKSCYIKFYYSYCKLCGFERHLISSCSTWHNPTKHIYGPDILLGLTMFRLFTYSQPLVVSTLFSVFTAFFFPECYVIDIIQVQLFHTGFSYLVYVSKIILHPLHIDRSFLPMDKW